MLTFNSRYFLATVILFLVEIFIAVFVRDQFIRPYLGDFLVVIFLYCLVKSFLKISIITAAVSVLLFAYAIEILQYIDLIGFLNLQNSEVAKIVLGNHFDWEDIVAYTLGIIFVVSIEKWKGNFLRKS